MINFLRGNVHALEENTITLLVGGVGYEVLSPSAQTLSIGKEASLHCYYHWSAEQGPSIFGFASQQERAVFLLILKCPGIGPKIALSILEQMSVGPFLQAILNGSIETLTALHGIGTRKAEQMIVQLKSAAQNLITSGKITVDAQSGGLQWKELADALQSLNYSRSEIAPVISSLRQQSTNDSFDQLLRKSLSLLSKSR